MLQKWPSTNEPSLNSDAYVTFFQESRLVEGVPFAIGLFGAHECPCSLTAREYSAACQHLDEKNEI